MQQLFWGIPGARIVFSGKFSFYFQFAIKMKFREIRGDTVDLLSVKTYVRD